MGKRTIPALELTSIQLGAEMAREISQDLAGEKVLTPVTITGVTIYCDSLVAIHWVNSYVHMDKQNKKTPYVRNRLAKLDHIAESCPLTIKHIDGIINPADFTTRPFSHKLLSNSNYWGGPAEKFRTTESSGISNAIEVTLPRAAVYATDGNDTTAHLSHMGRAEEEPAINNDTASSTNKRHFSWVPIERYSSYRKLWKVTTKIVEFVERLKGRLKKKDEEKYAHIEMRPDAAARAATLIIRAEQEIEYAEALQYLRAKANKRRICPVFSAL